MEKVSSGKIISLFSKDYLIKLEDDSIVSATAKGSFRNSKISPLVGDDVLVSITTNDGRDTQVYIKSIKERKNYLDRPNVSNVDNALILMSIHSPELSTLLIDKFLFNVSYADIKPIVVITKVDLIKDENDQKTLAGIVATYERLGVMCYSVTKMNSKFYDKISKQLENQYSVVVGQTGVGKSTFINHFKPQLSNLSKAVTIKTQEISKALGRGKHTTRTATIYELVNNIHIIDTPGFSSLEVNASPIDFSVHFSNLIFKTIDCKFSNCLHQGNEIGCKIVKAHKEGTLESFLYRNYLKILEEMKDNEY